MTKSDPFCCRPCSECGRSDRKISLREPRLCINCYRRMLREQGRLSDSNRRIGLRRLQKAAADYVDCPECGSRMARGASHCLECTQRASEERLARFIELRKGGLTNVEIGRREGVSWHVVANALCRAKQAGVDVGRSPHYRAEEVAA